MVLLLKAHTVPGALCTFDGNTIQCIPATFLEAGCFIEPLDVTQD
jgi:hypothetical protein